MLQLARWWMVLLGGALLGAGLVLHAEVALTRHLRDEVGGTFFLWRGVGQITFIFQDDVTKTALWANEVPEHLLVESDRAAWVLVALGGIIAIAAACVRKRPRSRRP